MAEGKLSVGLRNKPSLFVSAESNGSSFPSLPVQQSPSKGWPTHSEHPDVANGQEEADYSAKTAI